MSENILDIYVNENIIKGNVYPELSFVVAFETDDDEEPPPLYTFQIKKSIVCLTTIDSYKLLNKPTYFIRFSNVGDILHDNNADDNICTFGNNKFQAFIESIIINKALKILNKLKTTGCDLTKNTTCYNDLFLKIKKTYPTDMLLFPGKKIPEKLRFLNYWKSAASVNEKEYIINSNVNLIMRYFRNTDDTYSLDFGYAYVKSVAPTKKSLVTPNMEKIINTKLNDDTPSCVKDLFTINNSSNPPDLSINIGHAVIEIYTNNLVPHLLPEASKLADLKKKPYTLLAKDNVHTYLNIFLSMLDKPHDIIGARVSKANQSKLLNEIIIPNIRQYINYINNLVSISDKPIIKNFVTFIEIMLLSFEKIKLSKNFITEISYENAILYLICKYYSTSGEGLQILPISMPQIQAGITSQTFELNNLVPTPTPNNIVINPDIMNLTQEIKAKVNQEDKINKQFRHYFSAPEVIDHGHVYDISNDTIIEFPENYKEIQLLLNATEYLAIHSYSTTTNEPLLVGEGANLYYNIYVWFTKNTTTTPSSTQLFLLTKYKIPFNHAPDCSKVYEDYCNNLLTSPKKTNLDNLINNAINTIYTTPPTDTLITQTIKHLILDQIFNAKSLQDDQNQLQVNQLQTSIALPSSVSKDNIPTQFIGLCTDLASAANGINYYMSNPNRNPNSMVAYYHRVKKIWANNNRIFMDNSKSKANKMAAKDIYQIVSEKSAKKGGTKRKEIEEYEQNKKIKNDNYDAYPEYTETSLINKTSFIDKNLTDEEREENEATDPGFIQTEYNIMYDILYDQQDSKYKEQKYDFEKLFEPITTGNHHHYFEIFSNDFMTVFNNKFKQIIDLYDKDKDWDQLLSAPDMINALANNLLSDKNIFFAPDNAFGVDRSIDGQIELSNMLDSDYFTLVKIYNQKLPGLQVESENKLETSTSSPVTVYGGSKTRKETNKQKKNKTNKKKNNKTNKKRVNRIFRKTKKI